MKKIQVLLPEPTMKRLRSMARREDRPMSELIRRATEGWLEKQPERPRSSEASFTPTTYRLGLKVHDPRTLKEMLYDRDKPEA